MIFDQVTEVLDPIPHAAALNMAIDEVLLRDAVVPLLRLYRWARPAVSFGYFGRIAEIRTRWPLREPVRRWTGGGVVLHGEDLTYTLIIPRTAHFFSAPLPDSYRAIHARIAGLLPGAQLVDHENPRSSIACFEHAVQNDLLRDGRKIAGAAQRRTNRGLLHQGSIQIARTDNGLDARLAASLGRTVARRSLSDAELAEAESLSREKYASLGWLERR